MILSHFVEKLKIGKRYVLVDFLVHPNCEPHRWETAGPANKFVPVEVWNNIYKKLEDLCRRQFSKNSEGRCEIDEEYEFRLPEKVNYLLKYEFKDSNCRTLLNTLYAEKNSRLHSECLVVQVIDETKHLFRQLEEKRKAMENVQKVIQSLKVISEVGKEIFGNFNGEDGGKQSPKTKTDRHAENKESSPQPVDHKRKTNADVSFGGQQSPSMTLDDHSSSSVSKRRRMDKDSSPSRETIAGRLRKSSRMDGESLTANSSEGLASRILEMEPTLADPTDVVDWKFRLRTALNLVEDALRDRFGSPYWLDVPVS